MDREKVIKGLECCSIDDCSSMSCPYGIENDSNCLERLAKDALELLKEQEMPRLRLFNEREYVVKYTGDALQLLPDTMQELVRCKDCKHRPKEIPFTTTWGRHDTYLEFPEGSRCPCQCSNDPYYSWNPDDDWFCADGERRDVNE